LEKVYGKGLLGMYNEDGKLTHKRLRSSTNIPSSTFISLNLNGLGTIDAASAKAVLLGFINGIQYDEITSELQKDLAKATQSDCFYAGYGMIDTVELLAYDWKNIIGDGSFQWFNVLAYDPLHFTGDLSVIY